MNIHQLLHLSDDVRELGPLYTHSCFPFEEVLYSPQFGGGKTLLVSSHILRNQKGEWKEIVQAFYHQKSVNLPLIAKECFLTDFGPGTCPLKYIKSP